MENSLIFDKNHTLLGDKITGLIFGLTAAFMGLFLIFSNLLSTYCSQQYVNLAQSFLDGQVHFSQPPSCSSWDDASYFNGKYYWPLGILPAILLLPFVQIFGTGFQQGFVSLPLTLINIYLLYKIALIKTGKTRNSAVLSFAYVFSTAYYFVALTPVSWYLSHVVVTTMLLSAILTLITNKHPFVTGMFIAFAFLTRFSTILAVPFFVLYYLMSVESQTKWRFKDLVDKKFISKSLKFLLPIFIGILIFFGYNYSRFGDIFETGYRYQSLFKELTANREIGMWNIRHIPMNLYLFLLKGPQSVMQEGTGILIDIKPNGWGMSFLYTSPILLFIFFADLKNKMNVVALGTAGLIGLLLFGSFGLGSFQYGYRFALDFQPFLFVVLCDVFAKKEMDKRVILLVSLSALFNTFMIYG